MHELERLPNDATKAAEHTSPTDVPAKILKEPVRAADESCEETAATLLIDVFCTIVIVWVSVCAIYYAGLYFDGVWGQLLSCTRYFMLKQLTMQPQKCVHARNMHAERQQSPVE